MIDLYVSVLSSINLQLNVDSTIQFSKNNGRNTSFKTKQTITMYKVPLPYRQYP